jgi:hypothetical protein
MLDAQPNSPKVVMNPDSTSALRGRRDPSTKLWEVPLAPHNDNPPKQHSPRKTTPQVVAITNSAYKQKTLHDLLASLHVTAGLQPSSPGAPLLKYNT